MAFGRKNINPLDLSPNIAVGVNIPFTDNAVFTSNYQTKDAIKNNLINFFLTNPGERFLNPSFGGGLRNFIFEQISNDNLDFLKEDITSKIGIFFPNIIITSFIINRFDDTNTLEVKLTYRINNTDEVDEININFN